MYFTRDLKNRGKTFTFYTVFAWTCKTIIDYSSIQNSIQECYKKKNTKDTFISETPSDNLTNNLSWWHPKSCFLVPRKGSQVEAFQFGPFQSSKDATLKTQKWGQRLHIIKHMDRLLKVAVLPLPRLKWRF